MYMVLYIFCAGIYRFSLLQLMQAIFATYVACYFTSFKIGDRHRRNRDARLQWFMRMQIIGMQ